MASRSLVTIQKEGRVRHSASHWRTLIGVFERSGETRRAFCARHGLSVSTFDAWRKRLGKVGDGSEARAGAAEVFVELPHPPRWAAEAEITPGWDVELELGGGVVLRFRRGAAC